MPETEEKRETYQTPWQLDASGDPQDAGLIRDATGLPVADTWVVVKRSGGDRSLEREIAARIVEAVNNFAALRAELDKYKEVADAAEREKGDMIELVCRYKGDCELAERMIDTAMSGEHNKLERNDWTSLSASLGVTNLMAEKALAALHPAPGANDE